MLSKCVEGSVQSLEIAGMFGADKAARSSIARRDFVLIALAVFILNLGAKHFEPFLWLTSAGLVETGEIDAASLGAAKPGSCKEASK